MAEFPKEITTSSSFYQILSGVLLFIGFIVLEGIVLVKMTLGHSFLSDARSFGRTKITIILAVVAVPFLCLAIRDFLKQRKTKAITLLVLILLAVVYYFGTFFSVYVR